MDSDDEKTKLMFPRTDITEINLCIELTSTPLEMIFENVAQRQVLGANCTHLQMGDSEVL